MSLAAQARGSPHTGAIQKLLALWARNGNKFQLRISDGSVALVEETSVAYRGYALMMVVSYGGQLIAVNAVLHPASPERGPVFKFKLYQSLDWVYCDIPLSDFLRHVERMEGHEAAVYGWPLPRDLCEIVLAYGPSWNFKRTIVL